MKISVLKKHLVIIPFFAMLLLIQGCGSSSSGDTTGEISISVSLAGTTRSEPVFSTNDFSFRITGHGPVNSTFTITTGQGALTATAENLTPGTWAITAEALYHGQGSPVSFGDGTASIEVRKGEISTCQIPVTPFEGSGSLSITVNWDHSLVHNPVIESSLSRSGFDPITVNFNIGSGQADVSLPLDSGLYSLTLLLKDGDDYEFAGSADSIRIINAMTTSVSYMLTGNTGEGSVDISITINIPSPMVPDITGGSESITEGTAFTLAGSAPSETGDIHYYWYLDGRLKMEGSSYTIPQNLSVGHHRVDLIVFNSDYSRSGTRTFPFTVVQP